MTVRCRQDKCWGNRQLLPARKCSPPIGTLVGVCRSSLAAKTTTWLIDTVPHCFECRPGRRRIKCRVGRAVFAAVPIISVCRQWLFDTGKDGTFPPAPPQRCSVRAFNQKWVNTQKRSCSKKVGDLAHRGGRRKRLNNRPSLRWHWTGPQLCNDCRRGKQKGEDSSYCKTQNNLQLWCTCGGTNLHCFSESITAVKASNCQQQI